MRHQALSTALLEQTSYVQIHQNISGEKQDRTEPTIDVRVAVGDLSFGFPTDMHFDAIQRLTYEQVRSACLDYQLTKTA